MRAPFKAVFEVCRLSELTLLAEGKSVPYEEEGKEGEQNNASGE